MHRIETLYDRHGELLEGSEDLGDALDDLKKCVYAIDFISSASLTF